MTERREPDGVICFSTDPWGDMKRPVQLMRRLARRVPVLYVEPYLSVTSLLKNWQAAFRGMSTKRVGRALAGHPVELEPNLHVLTALVSIPPQRLSFTGSGSLVGTVGRAQHRRVVRAAYEAAFRLGMRAPVEWISYPISLAGVPRIDASTRVYDCMDRWSEFPDSLANTQWRELVAQFETQLLETADVVLCSAEGLFEAKQSVAKGRCALVRNGADVEHFAPLSRPVPADLASLPRPLVGYVGAVAEWVDFALVREAALLRPDWSYVLVGPVFQGKTMGNAGALRALDGLANVHVLGPRPYDSVPAYVEAFDVAMIPFVINGLTEDTNPIKVYEYLAAGVPVVSTPLREVVGLTGVRLASSASEFVVQAEAACAERRDPDLIGERIEAAATNSWDARAALAWEVISEHQPSPHRATD